MGYFKGDGYSIKMKTINYLIILFLFGTTAISFADRTCLVGYNSSNLVSDCEYKSTPKMTWVQFADWLNVGNETGILIQHQSFDYIKAIYFEECQYNQVFYDQYGECTP